MDNRKKLVKENNVSNGEMLDITIRKKTQKHNTCALLQSGYSVQYMYPDFISESYGAQSNTSMCNTHL